MRGAIFLFATDLHDEGPETVLDNVQERAGLQGVTLACAYHHARDIFPHNPVRKVRFLEGGTVFFRPDPRRYAGLRLTPQVSRLATEIDVLADLDVRCGRRGLAVRARTVYPAQHGPRRAPPRLRAPECLRRPVHHQSLPGQPGGPRLRPCPRRRSGGARCGDDPGGVARVWRL
jgi:hypothetical protein